MISDEIVRAAICAQFTDENAKEFLSRAWQAKRKKTRNSATGFCYLASWAFYEIVGGDGAGCVVMKWCSTNKNWEGHFWINKDGEQVDLTKDQYPEAFQHYDKGSRCRRPSRKQKLKVDAFTKLVIAEIDRQEQFSMMETTQNSATN